MDNFTFWIKQLAHWLQNHPLPAIPFVGFTNFGRYHNPPAEHLEISFLMTGSCHDLRIGDKRVTFEPNHIALHNVHFGNYSAVIPNARIWCLFIDVTGLAEFIPLSQTPFFEAIPALDTKRLAIAFENLAQRCLIPSLPRPAYLIGTKSYDPDRPQYNPLSRQLYIKAAFLELLAILLENTQELSDGQPNSQLQAVKHAVDFIARNYQRADLTLADIAEAVHLSENYFGQIFQRHTDTTPMRYLTAVRMEHAKLMLRQTHQPIAVIAKQTGIMDPLYFSRIFRQCAGQSPRQYRQKLRETTT